MVSRRSGRRRTLWGYVRVQTLRLTVNVLQSVMVV
jgi:hypothetical protein